MNTYIVWDSHENIVIRDVVPKMYGRICEYMVEQYFKINELFNTLQMQEEEGINDEYVVLLLHVLSNECSIVAIDEQTNTIYAVAMLKMMTKKWRSWVNLLEIIKSRKLNDFITLWHIMIMLYNREFPKHDFDSLHIFQYHISDELLRDAVFKRKFFNAISEVGRHMKMPRVTFIALTKNTQLHMEEAGFKKLSKIIYALYTTPQNMRPFSSLRDANEQSVIFYEKKLEPLTPYYEMPPFENVRPVNNAQVEPEKQPTANADGRDRSSG